MTHEPHWSYEEATGPEHWAALDEAFALCGSGTEQSPVDLSGAVPVEWNRVDRS